jgi:hypothetical protein
MENIQPKLWFSGPFLSLSSSKIWKNKKMLLQMTSGFLQLESTLHRDTEIVIYVISPVGYL